MHGQSPIISWETLELSGVAQRFARPKVVLEGIGIRIAYCKSSEWKSETISRPQSRDTGLEFPTEHLHSVIRTCSHTSAMTKVPAEEGELGAAAACGRQARVEAKTGRGDGEDRA